MKWDNERKVSYRHAPESLGFFKPFGTDWRF